MTSQTSAPQSSSCAHAAAMIRAASRRSAAPAAARRCLGFLALSAGLDRIHSHRTAAASAALMIQWTCRIDDAAIGLHACGGHSMTAQPDVSQSCGSGPGGPAVAGGARRGTRAAIAVRWSTAGSPPRHRCRHRRRSA